MTCNAQPWDLRSADNTLRCDLPLGHSNGHIFVASVGADLSDERAEES